VSRNDYFTAPQKLILLTGSYILAIACESVVCFYICKWNTFKQRRRVGAVQPGAAAAAAAATASWCAGSCLPAGMVQENRTAQYCAEGLPAAQ